MEDRVVLTGANMPYERRWRWVVGSGELGSDRSYWAPASVAAVQQVRLFPPTSGIDTWSVVVDGVELLRLRGPDAEELSFTAGDLLLRQAYRLTEVLRMQGFQSRSA